MSWSPEQYTKFEAERNRPVIDLLAHIPTRQVKTAADIGCGPGNSTELLQQRYPQAVITGMDSSAEMIEAARKRLPGIRFEVADIAGWRGQGPYDLILANAVLQWVPGHETLLPALVEKLKPGGTLAIQMPDNFDEPSHRLMRETAARGSWAGKLAASSKKTDRESPAWYYGKLKNAASALDIWRTIYYHPLKGGATAIVEWFKGTALRPYLDALPESERKNFLLQYEAAIAQAYPVYPDGTVLLPFPRLFIVATRR